MIGNVGLSVFRKIADLWKGAKSQSLIDYTEVARVEPVQILDADVIHLDYIHDIQQSLLAIFAGYWLQALAISMNVGKIEVMHHLDKLNPKRNPSDSALNTAGWLFASESYKHRLPRPGEHVLSQEAPGDAIAHLLRSDANDPADFRSVRDSTMSRGTMDAMKELSNLSVGKMLSVEITDGAHSGFVPVQIRLMASVMRTDNLAHLLATGSMDTSVKERYWGWRSDRLEFFKDMLLCRDLIDAHRRNLMKDDDSIYANIVARHRSNQLSSFVSGNSSVANWSSIAVISTETAMKIENSISGRLRDFKTRQRVFSAIYLMILVVVDKSWERVTFYYHNQPFPTECSLKDLKNASKGSGPDVAEIFHALRKSQAPMI